MGKDEALMVVFVERCLDGGKVECASPEEIDKWIISKTYSIQSKILEHYKSYEFHQVIQKIHNFCVNDLGGFYLDVIKDRQYTTQTNSDARRSAQTAINIVLNVMVRLISPILSFTAEEIWQSCPNLNNQEESVFLSNYLTNENKDKLEISNEEWKRLFEIKDSVNQSIEQLRNDNKLKGSLDAVVNIEAHDADFSILEKLGTELHFLFISSEANIKKGSSLKKSKASRKNVKRKKT